LPFNKHIRLFSRYNRVQVDEKAPASRRHCRRFAARRPTRGRAHCVWFRNCKKGVLWFELPDEQESHGHALPDACGFWFGLPAKLLSGCGATEYCPIGSKHQAKRW
jgi:hypothetical protein